MTAPGSLVVRPTGAPEETPPARRRHDLRLLAGAVAAWGTSWLLLAGSVVPAVGVAVVATTVAALLTPGRGGRSLRCTAALVLLCVAAAAASCGGALAHRRWGPAPAWADAGATAEIHGVVAGDPHRVRAPEGRPDMPPRYAVTIAARTMRVHGQIARVHTDVVVLGDAAWAAVSVGARVGAVGRLRATAAADRPVAFLRALGPPRASRPPLVWRASDRLRGGLREASSGHGAQAGGLLPALVVGDVSGLPEDLESDMREAGLTHLTAVSGANLAIVSAAVLLVLLRLGAGRRLRAVATTAGVLAFCVVARPQPSVLRAAAMAVVLLAALALGRRGAAAPVLGAAVLVVVLADPWLARSPGFALSVLATAGLLFLVRPLAARLPGRGGPPGKLRMALAAPVAAQVACTPVLLLLQPGVSVIAVPANLLAEPAAALATISGAVATVAATFSPRLASVCALPGLAATQWIAVVAHAAAGVPGGTVPWPQGVRGALTFCAAAGAMAAALVTGASRRRVGRHAPWA